MPMESSGMMIWGLPSEVFLMFASGVFYFICAFLLWKPLRQEKNELLSALFAFLIYQAFAMILMGVGMYSMQMIYDNLSALAIFIGSAYMLKFPFSFFGEKMRKILFPLSIIAVLCLFAWFVISPEREMALMHFSIWYDIIVNGIVVGLFMIITGSRARETWFKVKAVGGGVGVTSCCVVANVATISGAIVLSSVFQFLAPVIIVLSILTGRKIQKRFNA